MSNQRSIQQSKPLCVVCKNAGKTPEEYTSHFTKSSTKPDAVVTCPTILNSVCTYCKKTGHFKSKCDVLLNRKTITEIETKPKPTPKTKDTTNSKPKPTNIYSVFNNIDFVEKPKKISKKLEEFPELSPKSIEKSNEKNKTKTISYADKVTMVVETKNNETKNHETKTETKTIEVETEAKIIEEFPVLKMKLDIMKQCTKEPVQISYPKKEVKNFTQLSLFNKTKNNHNWADDNFWNDDEDEDEDEDEDLIQSQELESYNQDVYWYE